MKKRLWIFLGTIAGLFLLGWLALLNPKPTTVAFNLLTGHDTHEQPPGWFQRIQQRREVRARVQSAGGWDALRSDCMRWLQENQDTNFVIWYRGQTNGPALPPAIAALKPRFINAFPPDQVDIDLFGSGEGPGHRGIANYGLEVICSPNPPNQGKLCSNCTYRKIAKDIYERY